MGKFRQYLKLLKSKLGLPEFKRISLPEIFEGFHSAGLVNVSKAKQPDKRSLTLIVPVADVQFAFKDDPYCKALLERGTTAKWRRLA
jgi:hypothetical protein